MMTRIVLLVLDGFGIGSLPDAESYGDAGCNTLQRLAAISKGLTLPNLEQLGLGLLGQFQGIRPMTQPEGCYGKLGFTTRGKHSLAGHWELAGYVIEEGARPYEAFTKELASGLEVALGQKTLGNCRTVRLEPIAEFGAEHQKSGMPIAWIDTAGTVMLAAHEQVVPPEELYRLAREARRRLKATMPIVRVVAYPFTGQPGQFAVTERRRDFAVEPPGLTLLDHLSQASQLVFGVGKVGDLFSGRGVTRSVPLFQAQAVMDEVIGMFSKAPRGLIYASLPIMSPDLQETVSTLQHVDRRLRDLQECLKVGDVLIITGDHGFDCARPTPGHSREYVPCLVTGPRLARGVNLGTRTTAADLAQTIGEALGATRLPWGDSFLDALQSR
ncbi:MAG: phosphopentomutase [Nitrospira sp. CR1.1]|jgi:phosphopentomutase|nr:phosphopentomutase [Nitrospira sp. CR1.1]